MSRRQLEGALLAALVVVGICVYLASRRGPSKPTEPTEDSTGKIHSVPQVQKNRLPPQPRSRNGRLATATGSISGTARIHGTNAPAVGVAVWAISRQGTVVQQVALTQTDEKGSYTLAALPLPQSRGRSFWIMAEDEQAALFLLEPAKVNVKPGEYKMGVNLTLYAGRNGSICGKVVGRRLSRQAPKQLTPNQGPTAFERSTDTPLSGVKIVLQRLDVLDKLPLAWGRQEALSDETGRYGFSGLRSGHYMVIAERPPGAAKETIWKWMQQSRPGVADESTVTLGVVLKSEPKTDADFVFRLDGVSITGRVTDTNGSPIEGAEVSVEYCSKDSTQGMKVERRDSGIRGTTDSDGHYLLTDLPPVNFVEAYNYIASGQLHRWYEARADAEGASPVRKKVPPFTDNLLGASMRVVEDVIANLNPETLEAEEFGGKFPEVDLPRSQGDVIIVDFVLQEEAVVAGRVVDSHGRIVQTPASIRAVNLETLSSETLPVDPFSERGWTRLDDGGRFRITDLRAGRYSFEVQTKELGLQQAINQDLEVREGEAIEDFEVIIGSAEDRGDLIGLVRDAGTRKPVQRFGFSVLQSETMDGSDFRIGHIVQAVDGRLALERMTPGTVTLEIRAVGYIREQAVVTVPRGETVEKTFYLKSRGRIAGQVLDARSGEPVEKISVKVARVDSSVEENAARGQVTIDRSQQGAFSVTDISPGVATLVVSAPGYAREEVQSEVAGGATTKETIRLSPECRLSGYVACNGEPEVADVALGESEKGQEKAFSTRSDKTGYYELKGLPEGEYSVTATFIIRRTPRLEGRPRATRKSFARVHVKPGDTSLDFKIKGDAGIRGRFTCPDDKRHMYVLILEGQRDAPLSAGDQWCAGFANSFRRLWAFEVVTLPPGTYTVIGGCSSPGAKPPYEKQSRIVTLEAGQVEEVDFVFP